MNKIHSENIRYGGKALIDVLTNLLNDIKQIFDINKEFNGYL